MICRLLFSQISGILLRIVNQRTKQIYGKNALKLISLFTYRNEVSSEPSIIIDGFVDRLLDTINSDFGVTNIGELGRRVVTPNSDLAHLIDSNSQTIGNLERKKN